MENTKHLLISILLALAVIILGTLGYFVIEGWNILDALYMTVITISTVGYGEVHHVSKAGRLFTIVLVFLGVGFTLYATSAIVQLMVEGQIRTILGRRRLDKKINRLKNHYIVCGYGRIGRVLSNILRKKPLDIVIIEKDPELVQAMDKDNVLYISGEATDEATLIKAGVKRAKALIAVLGSDTDNVFLVLTAKQLKPDLFVIARATLNESKPKLQAAGADKVESPNEIGAMNMAYRILRPTITSFLDFALDYKSNDIEMEEMPVSPSSDLVNVMLKDSRIRQEYNLIIIAIKKSDGSMLFNPSFEAIIEPGDTVVAIGENKNLQKLELRLNP